MKNQTLKNIKAIVAAFGDIAEKCPELKGFQYELHSQPIMDVVDAAFQLDIELNEPSFILSNAGYYWFELTLPNATISVFSVETNKKISTLLSNEKA